MRRYSCAPRHRLRSRAGSRPPGRRRDAARASARRCGFDVDVVPPTLDEHGVPISSSAVRTAIAHGDLEHARAALGRPYAFRGTVVPGHRRGRDLGYPTLNIALASTRKLLPPAGVYAVRAATRARLLRRHDEPRSAPDVRRITSAASRCICSTRAATGTARQMSIEMIRRLRDTTRFRVVDALVEQLGRDADDGPLRVDPSLRAS